MRAPGSSSISTVSGPTATLRPEMVSTSVAGAFGPPVPYPSSRWSWSVRTTLVVEQAPEPTLSIAANTRTPNCPVRQFMRRHHQSKPRARPAPERSTLSASDRNPPVKFRTQMSRCYDAPMRDTAKEAFERLHIPPQNRALLTLDGGGIRGIMTIQLLKALEEQAGAPCFRIFDLCAGTSTGGIIAGLIASGRTALE